MQRDKELKNLFERYLQNLCTSEEIKFLLHLFSAGRDEDLLRALVREQLEKDHSESLATTASGQKLLDQVFQKVQEEIAGTQPRKRISKLNRKAWFTITAAASVVAAVAITFLLMNQNKQHQKIASLNQSSRQVNKEALGHSNALLTLADGTSIVLDSVANGMLTQQGKTKVFKFNGAISYGHSGTNQEGETVYNTISTARGNQYQLVLSDGSKVWLNAASKLRFPVAFKGDERSVEVSGEAYFEITKDPTRPFKVSILSAQAKSGEVEVLGTHFDINAYEEEPDIKTTLLEGRVKITNNKAVKLLSVGQQAALTNEGIQIQDHVDVDQEIAWKEGYFSFNNADIHTIMRQVARWYDVDVVFEGSGNAEGFSGKITRDVSLSKFLQVLELNDVEIRKEGKTLIVKL